MVTQDKERPRFPQWLLVVLILFALATLAGGVWQYRAQTQQGRGTVENDLLTVTQLKTQQIIDWRAEQLADAEMIAGNSFFADAVIAWMATQSPTDKDRILAWFRNLAATDRYSDVQLLDASGQVLLSLSSGAGAAASEDQDQAGLRDALQKNKAVLTELHFAPDGQAVHLDAIAPLSAPDGGSNRPLAAIVLSSNASEFLYPLIQSWPTPSPSAETLLVRRDGDQVLYLNDLRNQSDVALRLQIPLTRTDLPAVQAVLGKTGLFLGHDYRGVQVLAVLAPIPDSPWFIVGKVDTSEAFAGLHTRLALELGLICLLLLALFGAVGFVYQRGQKQHYREAYEAETARRAMLTRYEHLVRQANDIILVTDPDQLVIEANDRASEIFGCSHEELLTLHLGDLVPPEEHEAMAARVTEVLEKGSLSQEAVYMKRDGTLFPVTVSNRAIVLGHSPCIQAIIHDTTEAKRAEEKQRRLEIQMQQSQKLESLGVLAGGIAHDFNNILMAILGYTELALAQLSQASPVRDDLLQIAVASRRAAELCRQMLAYSGRGHFIIEKVDLAGLAGDMIQLLRSTISKKILLNLNLEKNLPPVCGDPAQLTQVIMNLVINASEAIGDRSGVITISTGAQQCSSEYLLETYGAANLQGGLFVTLEVSDTGSGMDKQTQQRLFEPFFTTKFAGRGLGLSAVLGIVRGHKGALKVYSELGKGTTFKLLFPAAEVEAAETGVLGKNEAERWTGTGTVLLVDDEETIRALGTRMLAQLGFEVLTAKDGVDGLEVYREHKDTISLVLLDLTMPHMNGEEAYRELRQIDPEVRVVLSSGYTENDLSSRFAGKGLVGFIQKPYTLAQLRERLRAALDTKQSTQEEEEHWAPRS